MRTKHFIHALQYLFVFITVTGLLLFCTEPPDDDRIVIENDLGTLAARVTQLNEEVVLDTSIQETGLGKASVKPVTLTLIAEVQPPVVGGEVLQATDVYEKSGIVYVAYNMQGEQYLGAVDIFDTKDKDDPELISSMHFIDSDVNGLAFEKDYLYLAMATNRSEFDSPAVVERVKVKNGKLSDETVTYDVPSWAATDVEATANHLFVTSGADGGQVTVIKLSDHSVEFSYPVEDARGVNTDKEEVAVVAGTPARLLTFDYESGEKLMDYTLSGANIPFSKSTIEVLKRKAVLALGDGGVQVVCLESGAVVETIAPPVVDGLDPSVTVANAATTNGKTIYMSNGEAGIYIAYSKDDFNGKNCDVDDLQMIGSFRLDDLESVNHLALKGDFLFAAGGLGGLKIFKAHEK